MITPRLAAGLALSLALGCAAEGPDFAPDDLRSPGFAGGFAPAHAPYGGFGGAAHCAPSRTPVILLHGNTESAADWLRSDSKGGPSVPAQLYAAGYRKCEVFAVTWLPLAGRSVEQAHFHDPAIADQVAGFVADVRAYTGAAQVDVVGHSMGVTVGLHALDRGTLWPQVRRFVALAGALRGLDECLAVGAANPLVPACGAQSVLDPDVFGFYPAFNPRMEAGGFRDQPARHPSVAFASILAGASDEILCPGSCSSALFDAAPNVRAQLDVGVGLPGKGDHDDTSGVGHFRVRRDTGLVQVNLLATDCTGSACCRGYAGRCVE